MPVVAVVGAIVAGAIAAPAVGAVIAGGALSLSGALEITAAVGATMSAVGAVTRDKGLTTAGAVIGGVGAIGSLASSAGLIDGSQTLFGDGAASAGQTASAAASAVPDSVAVTPEIAGSNPGGFLGAGADITDSFSQGVTAGLPDGAGNPVLAEDAETAIPTDATATPPPAATPAGVPDDEATQSANLGSGMINSGSASVPSDAIPPSPLQTPQAAQQAGSGVSVQSTGEASYDEASKSWQPGAEGFPTPGYLDGILNFAGKNQLVTYGAIQAGGALIGGMFSPITPAQVSALDAQAANNRAAAGLTAQQTKNIQSGVPSAQPVSAANVTGKPASTTPGTGLINSNPNSGAVTGVPYAA